MGETARNCAERVRELLERLEEPVLDHVAERIDSRRNRNIGRLAINARPGAPGELHHGKMGADAEPDAAAMWDDGPING
jgi:hypothetical protein